ncbi:hypothetical protein ACKFKF_10150 [Phormidesmis sp. 146-12]
MNLTHQIRENLDNPAELERLFREDAEAFQVAFELFVHLVRSLAQLLLIR